MIANLGMFCWNKNDISPNLQIPVNHECKLKQRNNITI